MFQFKLYHTFQSRLYDISDSCISQMLAEQHAEVWRSQGTWFVFARKIDQRERRTCGNK